MKKIKYTFLLVLMLFSFYLSDKVTDLAINKNPIMENIKSVSSAYYNSGENAEIIDNTIIPGIKGSKINEKESFFKMKEFGSFNETFLVYDKIKPEISLSDNLDKIIISGNKSKRQVSIIIEDDDTLKKILNKYNIKYDVLANLKTKLENQEYLNSEQDKTNFNDLESILKKNKINKNICIINYSNIEQCENKRKYLVSPNIILTNSLIVKQKQNIENGSIILINKNIKEESIKIIINQIKYLDLNIVFLSKLITE